MAVTLAAAALAPGLKAPGRTPQVLRLRDATTGQEISLVGTVHYNPASVARAKDEVSSALDRSTVGAVVVESCTSRWGRSLELAPPGSLPARLICSEMQGAAGVAMQNQVPVMLGDADAGPFLERVRALAGQSAGDLLNPVGGGWASIYTDFARTLPGTRALSKCSPWLCSAPAPPQDAPAGSGQLGTPRKRPTHWAPSHGLGCSSQPPPKSPIPPPLSIQVSCRSTGAPRKSSNRSSRGRRCSPAVAPRLPASRLPPPTSLVAAAPCTFEAS